MYKYEYYPIKIKLNDKNIYMIYASGDKDYVVHKRQGLIYFKDLEELINFSNINDIKPLHYEEHYEYDLNKIMDFLSNDSLILNKQEELMNFWNLIDDISESRSFKWREFIILSKKIRYLHQKLFFESDVLSKFEMNRDDWSEEDISLLKTLFTKGLEILRSEIIFFKNDFLL